LPGDYHSVAAVEIVVIVAVAAVIVIVGIIIAPNSSFNPSSTHLAISGLDSMLPILDDEQRTISSAFLPVIAVHSMLLRRERITSIIAFGEKMEVWQNPMVISDGHKLLDGSFSSMVRKLRIVSVHGYSMPRRLSDVSEGMYEKH
jgi:hypothetical protein